MLDKHGISMDFLLLAGSTLKETSATNRRQRPMSPLTVAPADHDAMMGMAARKERKCEAEEARVKNGNYETTEG